MNAGCPGRIVRSLRTRAISERLRGVFTTIRYTNPRLPYLYLIETAWAPACMGKREHLPPSPLEGALWKCCKVFCALVVTAKRPVDELFYALFSRVALIPYPYRGSIPGFAGNFRLQTPNLPIPGKNPAGAPARQ